MSKRFGRNQKRKLLEQVKEAKAWGHEANEGWKMANALISRQRGIIDDQRNVIELVEEILGKNFIGLPPEEIEVAKNLDKIRFPASRREARFRFDADVTMQVCETLLELEKSGMDGFIDRMSREVHFRWKSPEGECGYMVAPESWWALPPERRKEIAMTEVAHSMANYISRKTELFK